MYEKIDQIRKEINKIDEFIIYLLFKRIELIKKIALLKKKYNIPLYIPKREELIINRCIMFANKLNISSDFIKLIFTNILNESKLIQKQINNIKNINF